MRTSQKNKLKTLILTGLGEVLGLFFFMFNAAVATTVLEHPRSLVHLAVEEAVLRRGILGIWMALVIYAIIKGPFGAFTGAHINPSVTLAFWKNGNIKRPQAIFYICLQFLAGIFAAWFNLKVIGSAFTEPKVNYATTMPGPAGVAIAFVAEFVITAILMFVILVLSHSSRHKNKLGWIVSLILLIYLVVETPLSGMSLNPARSLGPAIISGKWTAVWLYFAAPVSGAIIAQQIYQTMKKKGWFTSRTGRDLRARFSRYFQNDVFPQFPEEI
jgi:aquaporin Z